MKFTRFLLAANSALPATLSAANILAVDNDGWAKLASYGDFPNQGVKGGVPHIQRIDRASGERLAANFRPLLKRLLRVHTGLNLYKGHPDAPGFEKQFPDKASYGTIAAIEARDDGIYVKPVITPEGSALVESGWKYLSSFWNQEEIGRTPAGMPIASPFELKSVGLVLQPNIPGPAINAAITDPAFSVTTPDTTMLKDQLIALLALLGITVPAETADEQLAAFVDQAKAALKPKIEAEAELPAANAKIGTLTATVTALTAEKEQLAANVGTLTAKATADQLAAANAASAARAEAAAVVIGSAVLTGRIRPADQASATATLIAAANFKAEAERIHALPPVVKTAARFAPRNADKSQIQAANDRAVQVQAAVNARMSKRGEDYITAFTAVKNDPAHAALFAAMQSPDAAA